MGSEYETCEEIANVEQDGDSTGFHAILTITTAVTPYSGYAYWQTPDTSAGNTQY